MAKLILLPSILEIPIMAFIMLKACIHDVEDNGMSGWFLLAEGYNCPMAFTLMYMSRALCSAFLFKSQCLSFKWGLLPGSCAQACRTD